MKYRSNKGFLFTALIGAFILTLTSCGGKKDESLPAPAPTTPVPVAPPAPPAPLGGCGPTAGATPLNAGNPFFANLLGNTYGGVANSLSLILSSLSNNNGSQYYNNYPQSVVGGGQLVLSDLSRYNNGYPNQNTNSAFCVSSTNGAPGILDPSGKLQMVLQGSVSVLPPSNYPSYIYPNPPQQSQVVQVLIGYDCPAYLGAGARIQGCVRVTVGNPPIYAPMYYQAQ